jgi:hypothetical protein
MYEGRIEFVKVVIDYLPWRWDPGDILRIIGAHFSRLYCAITTFDKLAGMVERNLSQK